MIDFTIGNSSQRATSFSVGKCCDFARELQPEPDQPHLPRNRTSIQYAHLRGLSRRLARRRRTLRGGLGRIRASLVSCGSRLQGLALPARQQGRVKRLFAALKCILHLYAILLREHLFSFLLYRLWFLLRVARVRATGWEAFVPRTYLYTFCSGSRLRLNGRLFVGYVRIFVFLCALS